MPDPPQPSQDIPATASATPTSSDDLLRLAEAMTVVANRVTLEGGAPLQALVEATIDHIPRAASASITVLRSGRFRSEASTGPIAPRADGLQYELGSGPCVDAVLDDNVYVTGDVARDERWPEWGRRANDETGVRSVLAHRLTLLDDSDAIACLNVFSPEADAFGHRDVGAGLVLATHGSLLVTALGARDKAANLRNALESNREIGVAMGILMQRHRLTREQAFDVLRVASQDANRKVADIATEVADTGVLAISRWPAGVSDGAPRA
jgi:hypothetical protein